MSYLKRNLIPIVVGLVAIAGILVSTAVIVTRVRLEPRGERFAEAMRAQRGGAFGGEVLGIQVDDQLKVTSILAGSAAEQAGMRVGDQLTSVNGHAVKTLADVRTQLDAVAPNTDYALKVNRDGKSLDLKAHRSALAVPGATATPQGRLPFPGGPGGAPGTAPSQPPSPRGGTQGPRLGILVDPAQGGGLPVNTVTAGSPAEAAGLRVGDVITAANGTPTPTVEALQSIVASANFGGTVTLTVTRDGKPITVTVRLSQRQTPAGPGA